MKRISNTVLIISALIVIAAAGCAVTPSIIKEGANLNAYQYVYINPVKSSDGKIDKYGAAVLLRNVFESKELAVLNEKELKQLNKNDLLRVLFCNARYVYAQDEWEDLCTTVDITLCDSKGQEIYIGKGKHEGINIKKGIASGMKIALNGFAQAYIKYDPSLTARLLNKSENMEMIERIKEDPNAVFTGSGFIVSDKGLVATNYHVVAGAKHIGVFLPELNKSFPASVALKDAKNNLAILRLGNFSLKEVIGKDIPFRIKTAEHIKTGQKIFTIDLPLGKKSGKESKISTGIINSRFGLRDDPKLFQVSNPVQPGNSGSPMLNEDGEIIGIVVSSRNIKYFYEKVSAVPQNVNFCIKSDYVLKLIPLLPEEDEILKRKSKLKGKKLSEQAALITPFIVIIKIIK